MSRQARARSHHPLCISDPAGPHQHHRPRWAIQNTPTLSGGQIAPSNTDPTGPSPLHRPRWANIISTLLSCQISPKVSDLTGPKTNINSEELPNNSKGCQPRQSTRKGKPNL
ncbi:hypothetical protein AVEN_71991-1 [Araneus ventricosus]|uniref:Uncharacterized protein n=1 Tax=Araneus ventricosus TaxID=182803 RepID=A0A4Y2DD96_ARAVE|nr:hypothetical protein AVEN_71991-1 [Araneus ventricosus]